MNKKENELIFEQYITPRNTNKHQITAIVEALDHVMSLPRVKRHGRTLVSEADIVNWLRNYARARGQKLDPETEKKVEAYRKNGNWNPDEDERWNIHKGKHPIDAPPSDEQPADDSPSDEQPADGPPSDEQPADDSPGIDVNVVGKLQKAAVNGKIDIVRALRIIAGEVE